MQVGLFSGLAARPNKRQDAIAIATQPNLVVTYVRF